MLTRRPHTIREWVTTICSVIGVLALIGGGVWKLHVANAYDHEVARVDREVGRVEEYAAEGIKNATCFSLDLAIERLQRQKAKGEDWTPTDESYLQKLLRKWEKYCLSDGADVSLNMDA